VELDKEFACSFGNYISRVFKSDNNFLNQQFQFQYPFLNNLGLKTDKSWYDEHRMLPYPLTGLIGYSMLNNQQQNRF
jgi:hypothetical protein